MELNYRSEDTLAKALELWEKGSKRVGHPADWAKEKANVHLWSKQREICQSVMENEKTAVRAGHGVGKSLCAAVIADWWIDTHPVGETFVISTAPSTSQVHAVLWAEMAKVHERAKLAGEIQLSDNWVIGRTLVAQGRKPAEHNKHVFQGTHRKFLLAIIDEACGIPEWIWTAIDTLATGEFNRILAIGNPDDSSSHFAKICKPGSGWNSLKISVLESPNFTNEVVDEELRVSLTQRKWVDDKRNTWGEGSAIWDAKILGEFSENDEHSVIPWSWVIAAQRRHNEWLEAGSPELPGRKIIGADIARFGNDSTVFAHRTGVLIKRLEVFRKLDTEIVADLLKARMYIHEDLAVVDAGNMGAGVIDKLRHAGYIIKPFNFQARTKAMDRSRQWGMATQRSAAWWNMRELLDPATDSEIMLPDDEELAAELIAPRWSEQIGAKIYVESKDDIKKRLNRSTDKADAVIMAFWQPDYVYDSADDIDAVYYTDTEVKDGAVAWADDEKLMQEFGIAKEVLTW